VEFAPGVPTWILLAISSLNLAIAAIAFRRQYVRGAVPFGVIMVSVSLYTLGNAVRVASLTQSAYHIGTTVKYAGILGLGPAQLWFGLTYSDRDTLLDWRHWALLLALPVATFALVVTAPYHDLLWAVEGFVSRPPAASIAREDTALVWLNFAYTYTLAAATYALLAFVGLKRGRKYRRQVAVMLAGGIIPLVASMVLLSGSNPAATWDPAAFAFTITGVIFAVALFRFDFLDLMPIARHALVDEMADPVFVVDLEERIVDANTAAVELLDDETQDPLGEPASEVVPVYESLASRGTDADVTIETDGRLRYFDAERTTLTDRTDTPIGSLFIYRDVTERHIAEERFKRLIEGASDMVSVLDTSGTITYVSQSVENVLGFEPSEMTGENVVSYIHPDDQADIAEDLSKYVDDYGYTGNYRARVRDSDGEWRVLEVRAANLLDDPFVEGIVLNSRDVTEKQHRKRKLERQNERLDQFASVVSHDLRNPLNVAVGRLQLLDATLDGDRADTVDTIQRQLDRIEDIIEDSLALAQSGEIVTETEDVDLGRLAREAWANVDTDEATLVVDDSVRLAGDRNRLLNMFENLFRNSVEHNESTGLSVRVGALPGVGFYVEDTGEGIPPEKHEQAFERGYTTNRDGTGFGLAIVRDIVQAHGWAVSLSEGADGGVRFEVECDAIPLEKQAEHD